MENVRFSMRIAPDLLKILNKNADSDGLDMSTYLRMLILQDDEKQKEMKEKHKNNRNLFHAISHKVVKKHPKVNVVFHDKRKKQL